MNVCEKYHNPCHLDSTLKQFDYAKLGPDEIVDNFICNHKYRVHLANRKVKLMVN